MLKPPAIRNRSFQLMTMSPSINYAEQVLREEAERLVKLKEEASKVASASEAVKQKKDEDNLKASIAKVNLKDEEDFPTLGKAKGKK
jgi:DNA-directed RNA polymerase alpha subunit